MQVNGAIGFQIVTQTPEQVEGEMPVQPGILNPFGIVHAGAMLWFADVCATVLAFGSAEIAANAAGFPLGINLNANLVSNQRDGVLKATSVFIKRGRQLSVVRTSISGQNGRLLAEVTTSHIPAQAASGQQK